MPFNFFLSDRTKIMCADVIEHHYIAGSKTRADCTWEEGRACFRINVLLECFHNHFSRNSREIATFAFFIQLFTSVRSKNNNCIRERNFFICIVITKSASIKHLKEQMNNTNMSLFNLIKQKDTLRILGHKACYVTGFSIFVDLIRATKLQICLFISVFTHIKAHKGQLECLSSFLSQECFTDTGRARKQECGSWTFPGLVNHR